jgi:adenylosuccinate lyase
LEEYEPMSLDAISPLDGRYRDQVAPLADWFSEAALIRERLRVEVEWLIAMAASPWLPEVRELQPDEIAYLRTLIAGFNPEAAARVKEIEATTRHDVKAVEYFLKEQLQLMSLADVVEFVHFACTSEDINNLAYAQMLKGGLGEVWLAQAEKLVAAVTRMAETARDVPMLAHTHGQPASPTTVGKELAVFVGRWERQLRTIRGLEYLGKFNGAVGNFNAHVAAYPDAPWEEIARAFVESLGLTYNPLTTQIESHDYLAEACHAVARFNTITVDFARDCWFYIALGYFRQRVVAGEVGSSTMPHKVNPINFENAEANLELSTSLLSHLATRLPVSRMQRDLTDSSTLRNLGSALAYSYLALRAAMRGLDAVAVDRDALARDLDANWEVLAEAVQTVMRKAGLPDPYEQLKALTRGTAISAETMRAFIEGLDLPAEDKARLLALTPATYTGLAAQLADHIAHGDDGIRTVKPPDPVKVREPDPNAPWGPAGEAEVGELIQQLREGDNSEYDLRANAAFTLGQLGDAQAVGPLIEALRDEATVVRAEAAGALGGLGDERAVEPLIRALYDSQWEVRSNAALSLGALGDARVLPHLLRALLDPNEEVRYWAARACGDLGDRAALPALEEMRAHDAGETPEGRVRDAAAQAIARIQERPQSP